MLCEILKVGELRKSASTRSTALQVHCCLWSFISLRFALPYPPTELHAESGRNKMSSGTASPTCARTNTNMHRHILKVHKFPSPVKMKAAIMLSNCAAGSSLFSDAPHPHSNPFSLIHRLCEAHCAEKEMLCSRPLQIDVPFSFVFTCLNGRVGLGSAAD